VALPGKLDVLVQQRFVEQVRPVTTCLVPGSRAALRGHQQGREPVAPFYVVGQGRLESSVDDAALLDLAVAVESRVAGGVGTHAGIAWIGAEALGRTPRRRGRRLIIRRLLGMVRRPSRRWC